MGLFGRIHDMVKLVYKKTISIWSRIFAVLVSLFSFSGNARATSFQQATDTNLTQLTQRYNNIVAKIKSLENKIKVMDLSASSSSGLSSLSSEISALRTEAGTLSGNISSLKSKINQAITLNKVALTSTSYNYGN